MTKQRFYLCQEDVYSDQEGAWYRGKIYQKIPIDPKYAGRFLALSDTEASRYGGISVPAQLLVSRKPEEEQDDRLAKFRIII